MEIFVVSIPRGHWDRQVYGITIKIYLKERAFEVMGWIQLAYNR
jgi:hypothetical protein